MSFYSLKLNMLFIAFRSGFVFFVFFKKSKKMVKIDNDNKK